MEGQLRIVRLGKYEGWWKVLIDNDAECYCEQLFVDDDRTEIIATTRLCVPTKEEKDVKLVTELLRSHILPEWMVEN